MGKGDKSEKTVLQLLPQRPTRIMGIHKPLYCDFPKYENISLLSGKTIRNRYRKW